ncbi:hypothetical protein Pfo_018810 [Paulownia fortunei]|nr:hypothetical protein Pfo_018810 [Paulownia fortunei]
MSWTAANEQLEKVRMELDNKTFQTYSPRFPFRCPQISKIDCAACYQSWMSWTAANEQLERLEWNLTIRHSKHILLCISYIPSLPISFEIQQYSIIWLFCLCCPLSKPEVIAGSALVVDFEAAKDGELGILSIDVFTDAAPVVIALLDGYNVCIYAYGQIGTGKTFTMEGTDVNRGVNYRTLEELDFLSTETSKRLEIKQASEGFHHIPGIMEAKVENRNEVWNVLKAGSRARAVGSNNVNEHSSCSHWQGLLQPFHMLCIMVRAKLWLVDLAGSERLAKTDAQGERLTEAQNGSLSALGDVMSALAKKNSHIPYRISKLTPSTPRFITPSDQDLSETLSSLNFATRVRGVELGPCRKQIDTNFNRRLRELENKLKQQEELQSRTYQKKINDLESKLREQVQESESSSLILQHEVKELERKLKEQAQNQESPSLAQQIKELEDKVREPEKQLATTLVSESTTNPLRSHPLLKAINQSERISQTRLSIVS